MSKEDKKVPTEGQEDFILKKIRYYQGSIDDYETFWNKKIAEGEKEESPETKSFKKKNDDLNKAFEIIPVEKDDTTMCKDIASGKDKGEEDKESKGESKGDKEEKKEKKEEKKVEEEEEKVEDAKKEEKGEDDEKKSKKKEKKEE